MLAKLRNNMHLSQLMELFVIKDERTGFSEKRSQFALTGTKQMWYLKSLPAVPCRGGSSGYLAIRGEPDENLKSKKSEKIIF